jgi:hypothetical protein
MSLESKVMKFGIKGILVTDKPNFIERDKKDYFFKNIDDIKQYLLNNPIDAQEYDFVNYNLLDSDYQKLLDVKECIYVFSFKYDRRDNHKHNYKDTLKRYASIIWRL